ncbi:MAG: S8 family serine peptidase [Phycisphaerales bacterium]|nr:S8 family serine peptidase [Phycisphaerales bacterium]
MSSIHVVEVTRSMEADKLLDELTHDETVEYVHRVGLRYAMKTAAAAAPFPRQWGHQKIQLPAAQAASGFPGDDDVDDIVVAVVDSGIDKFHPDLKDAILDYKNYTPETDRDREGHGTHVAGIIAARKGSKNGIDGVARCRILALKGLSDPFDGPAYYQCLRYATDHADIINLSLGGADQDPTEILLIERAIRRNRIVVAAMGNEKQEGNPTSYPAVIDRVIAVGASDRNDKPARFSNTGKHILLTAPGVDILSTLPGKKYARWDGTSMATPYVSGAVALLLARRKYTPAQVRARLIKTADANGSAEFSEAIGYGRLNIRKLLQGQ